MVLEVIIKSQVKGEVRVSLTLFQVEIVKSSGVVENRPTLDGLMILFKRWQNSL